MKKITAILLLFVLCFSLCACQKNEQNGDIQTEPTIERVEASYLFDPVTNVAAAQMCIGKETTLFGRISEIAVDHCVINVAHSYDKNVTIYLDTSILAGFAVGEIKAFTGVVASVGASTYTLTDAIVEDNTTANTFIQNYINELFHGASGQAINYCNLHVIAQYVFEHPSEYRFDSIEAGEAYIANKWKIFVCHSSSSPFVGSYRLPTNGKGIYTTQGDYMSGDFEIKMNNNGTLELTHMNRNVAYTGDAYYLSEYYCFVNTFNIHTMQRSWFFLSRLS